MTDDNEGRDRCADVTRKAHAAGGTPLTSPESIIKVLTGGDLSKRKALPPQNDDAEDLEETGEAGQSEDDVANYGDAGQGRADRSKKRRKARADEDEARSDEDEDLDEDEDEDEAEDDAPLRAGRRDETGRFQRRVKATTKLLKTVHAAGGHPVGAEQLLDLSKLDSGGRLSKRDPQAAALSILATATGRARAGGATDLDLAKAVGAAYRALTR